MKYLILFVVFTAISAGVYSQDVYQTRDGAIKGYDPVAYFTKSEAVKGTDAYTFEWSGATWHFSSQENLEAFKREPEKYAPAYGGYCAYGVASGYKVKIEPEAWAIIDGRLFLNYDLAVQKEWNKEKADYIKKADKNWADLGKKD